MTFGTAIYTVLLKPLQLIFEVIYNVAYQNIKNPGLAIIALSLAINFLVLPLYMRADAIQEEERDTEAKLNKWVTHIKKTFHGDERTMMLQTYYRQNHYSPTYVLRSAVSLFLEIPLRHLRPCIRCSPHVTLVPTQIANQQSVCDLKRRKRGASELSTSGGSERYEVASDEGKQSLRPTLSVAGSR